MARLDDPHVLVMAKAPVPGTVKTRLCPPCTPEEAATIAEAALRDTFAAVEGSQGARRIVALDGAPGPWLPDGWSIVPQVRGTFASRLSAAWRAAGGPGIQIGMDTPQVTAETLDSILDALLTHGVDAVLGLAEDGGWWVLGQRDPHPDAFVGVPMSTARTGDAQLHRLHSLGLRVEVVAVCRDLDTVADAIAIASVAPTTHTARAVHRVLGAPVP
jgi:glycosyltransferase A (GT-A) superfamily protein (DUF2064 family)